MKSYFPLLITLLLSTFVSLNSFSQNYDWALSIGGIHHDDSQNVVVDSFGNIYVTGSFRDTVDFDPSTNAFYLTCPAYADIYVAKYTPQGNFVWARSLEGLSSNVYSNLTVDNQGNVLICGQFVDTIDLDPGPGVIDSVSHGARDFFITKLDSNGVYVWAKVFGGVNEDYCFSVETDDNGNVYATGRFYDTVDFDPGNAVVNLVSQGYSDAYILKLDVNGDFVWVKQIKGSSTVIGMNLGFDAEGNIYSTGRFLETVDFDPGISTYQLTSFGSFDIFILKLDSNADFVWAKLMGGANSEVPYDMKVDANGFIYTTGIFYDTADFDPGSSVVNFVAKGKNDVFISKIDKNGAYVWAKHIGGSRYDYSNSIAIDDYGDVYFTGNFYDTIDFNPGAATYNLISAGVYDMFISKLNTNGEFEWAERIGNSDNGYSNSICIDNSGNIITVGKFHGTVDFDPSPAVNNMTPFSAAYDGYILKQNQSYCTPSFASVSVLACDSFTWSVNNQTYYNSGVYIDTIFNYYACDSIVTLHLTFAGPVVSYDVVEACNSYTWINGITYFSDNNTDSVVLSCTNGCDSIVKLDLTINHIVVSVSLSDPVISSIATGVHYQWLDCNNNYSVMVGDTNQVFTASVNGNYAVEVSDGTCIDTSVCVQITSTGFAESQIFKNVSIFPNPSNGKVNVELGNLENINIRVSNVIGQIVYSVESVQGPVYQFELEGAAGVYFVELNQGSSSQRYRLIKR